MNAWAKAAKTRVRFLKENKDIRDKLENALRKKLEIAIPGGSNAGAPGPNGHTAATAHGDKPPMKAAAAATTQAEPTPAKPVRRANNTVSFVGPEPARYNCGSMC